MRKKITPKTNDLEAASSKLRETCFKLRGLAYLIEQCGDDPCTPLDIGDICNGVGLILNQLHAEALAIARELD